MYHPDIISRNISRVESALHIQLVDFTPAEISAWVDHLESITTTDAPYSFTRPLTTEEAEFVRNERLLCKLNFRHWHDNYCTLARDSNTGDSGTGTSTLWEPQLLLLQRIGDAELAREEILAAGAPFTGIHIADHKARQLGHTHLSRALNNHLLTLHSGIRSIAVSVDDEKIAELFDRDKLTLDSLPHWLLPPISRSGPDINYFEGKNDHIHFKSLNSRIVYQTAAQSSGLGQGRQFEFCHLTEVASFPYPLIIENDLFPTLEHPANLTILESTAQGRVSWWREFTTMVKEGKVPGWIYHFTPWYVESRKYRLAYPADWVMSDLTAQHAELCTRTSPEYCFGRTLSPSKEQLYWYEINYKRASEGGTLNLFLANYCATHEQSFQHSTQSAFDFDTLEWMRLQATTGVGYQPVIGGVVQ